MITLVATLVVKSEAVEVLKEDCKKMVSHVKENEPGCTMYEPYVDTKNPLAITFIEKYVDQEAFENHMNTPYFKEFFAKLESLLAEPPQLKVLTDF